MGFMSSLSGILNTALPVVASAIGGPSLAQAVTNTQIAGAAGRARQAGATVQALQAAGAIAPGGVLAAPSAAKNKTITLVRVVNAAGQTVSEVVLGGRPFIMQKDFITFKRVKKLIGKASRRIGGSKRGSKKAIESAERMGLLEGLAAAGNETATALALLDD